MERGKLAVVLSLGADCVERAYALYGIFARCGFSGQHYRACAVVYGVCNVADFGTGRTRRGCHALEHLSCGDYIFSLCNALADKCFLDFGELDKRNFNAHIAAGYHDSVGVIDDFVHIVNAALVLDFGDNFNVLVADTVDKVAERSDVLVIAYKRRRNNVCALRKAELDIASVLSAYIRHADMIAGNIEALAVLELAALVYAADNAVGANLLHDERNHTVVKQKLSADSLRALVEEQVDTLWI